MKTECTLHGNPKPVIGDRITFMSNTKDSNVKATRLVNGFYRMLDAVTVRYMGHTNWIVRPHEIIKVDKQTT